MKTLLLILSLIFAVQGGDLILHMYNMEVEMNTPYCREIEKGNDSTAYQITFLVEGKKPQAVICHKVWQRNNHLYIFAPWFKGEFTVSNIEYYGIQEVKLVKEGF